MKINCCCCNLWLPCAGWRHYHHHKNGQQVYGYGVEFNSNFQANRALDHTDFQYEYGQGFRFLVEGGMGQLP
jgi:hypothetical protein